jgi:hypothetical protein
MSYLSHLTHLDLIIGNTGPSASSHPPTDTIVERVANVSATVKYFRLAMKFMALEWTAIERNEDGSYKGWQFAGKQEEVPWGGFFVGAPRRAVLGF